MADYPSLSTDDSTDGQPEDLFRTLVAWFRQDREAQNEWRKEAELDYSFHAGHGQWDEEDRVRLRQQQRPCITFNRIQPVISAVVGMAINDRKEVTFLPRTTQNGPQQVQGGIDPNTGAPVQPQMVAGADDQGPAETFTAGAQYLRDQCDAEDEEADAFQDTAICGMGWIETTVSYNENPDGDLQETRIDPLEMVWDCKSQKRNLADSRRNWWVREVDVADAERYLKKGQTLADLDAAWARLPQQTEPHDREAARHYESEPSTDWDPRRKTVTMVHCEYMVIEDGYKAANVDTGEVAVVEKDQLKQLKENAKIAGVNLKISRQPKKVYYTAILGADVIEWDKSQSQKAFARQPITGYRDRNKKQWVGLVRSMRDPQRWANALFSSVLHQIQTSGKGLMAEKDAFENAEKAQADWANGGRIVWMKTGSISGQQPKVKQKDQNAIPPGTMELMQFAIGSLRDVTGVNIEAMGLADRQQAASLEYQRRQAASTILAPFFDGFRRYRKENGRLILDLMRQFLSDGRLVRVVGPDYEKYVPMLRDDDTLEYDIIIDESPSSPNQKEANWMILQQVLPILAKNASPGVITEFLRMSPFPESAVNDIKDAWEKDQQAAAQQPNPEMMKLQADLQMQQMDAQIAQQKAQGDMMLGQQKAQADLTLKNLDIEMKKLEIQLEQFKVASQIQISRESMDMERERHQMAKEQAAMGLAATSAKTDSAISIAQTKAKQAKQPTQ